MTVGHQTCLDRVFRQGIGRSVDSGEVMLRPAVASSNAKAAEDAAAEVHADVRAAFEGPPPVIVVAARLEARIDGGLSTDPIDPARQSFSDDGQRAACVVERR